MTITDYHRAIFDYLEAYRAEHPEAHLTYALRTRNSLGRSQGKYLFTGTEEYIFIGMYALNDGNNKTRTIGFLCDYDRGLGKITRCQLQIVFGDPVLNRTQRGVHEKIVNRIGKNQFKKRGNNKYRLAYPLEADWQTNLEAYLTDHKPLIDQVIEESGLKDVFFIPTAKLEQQIATVIAAQTTPMIPTDRTRYYCVGTHLGSKGDQLAHFMQEGIWENGYGGGSPKLARVTSSVPVGAKLAAKTKSIKSGVLFIRAVGTVVENPKDGRLLKVNWQGVDYRIPDLGHAYPDTIREVQRSDDIALIFEGKLRTLPETTVTNSSINPVGVLPDIPKNAILYGPPGTGKTFETIGLAVEIIDGKRADAHRDNKIRFDELREAKQIEFVTFHQNYTYEDFVVGIRPDTTAGTLMFEPSYGIFYNIAARARANYKQSKEPNAALAQHPFDEVFAELTEPLVDRDEPVAIRMAKGKTFEMTAVSDRNVDFEKSNGSTIHALSIATLKRAYEGLQEIRSDGLGVYYRPLVQKLWEMGKQTNVNSSTWSEHPQRYVLIIDEINRANMSRVFGELITLLEDDKRLGEENALTVTLPNGELFNVPPNLYIVGTMNTADKSLALLDVALRRRFEFIGKYPQPSLLSAEAKPLLERLNKAIFQEKRSTDFLIGHAYFMGKSPLEAVMSKRVFPLLMEYFGGNQSRVEKLLQDADIPFHADPVTYQLCYGSATSH